MDVDKRRNEFLRRISFHVGGDTTVWEMDIYEIGREWGYSDDEIDSFLQYWEAKQCIDVAPDLGRETSAIRLTSDGYKCVRDVLFL